MERRMRFEVDGYEVKSQSSGIKDYSYCDSVEPKIGEVFEYKDIVLKCEKGNCPECFFGSDIYEHPCNAFKCEERERKDRKGVCFVEVSQKEKPTASDEPSPTKGEGGGVHKRTPQEIADFFDCYVAMDEKGSWYMYEHAPMLKPIDRIWVCKHGESLLLYSLCSDALNILDIPVVHNWRTLYRPHLEPLVVEEEE